MGSASRAGHSGADCSTAAVLAADSLLLPGEYEIVPIDSIEPSDWNVNEGDCGAIQESITANKFYGAVIVQKGTDKIIAGKHRWLSLKAAGETMVPIIRHEVSDDELKRIMLSDNRTARLGHDNEAELAALLKQLALDSDRGLAGTGFDGDYLDQLLADLGEQALAKGLTDEDEVPEAPADPVTVLGDVWLCGRHRVMCGDSTEDLGFLMGQQRAAVVITDPPYNVGFSYGENVDDEKSAAEYVKWCRKWFIAAKSISDSAVVLTSGITNLPMWIAEIERTHKIIAWVKENNCSRNYIGTTSGFQTWEPILVYGKAKKCVARDSFSIPIHMQADAEGHPCPKSIKAWTWLLEAFSDPKDLVADPFLGSGTTLIACEKESRRCFGIELEPKYVDVAIIRWQNFTGQSATFEADGRSFDAVAAKRKQVAA